MRNATVFAVLTVLTALTAYWVARRPRRHGFASARAQEVAAEARELFERGDATYAAFRTSVRGADPVLHADARRLWRQGALTPEAVDSVLGGARSA